MDDSSGFLTSPTPNQDSSSGLATDLVKLADRSQALSDEVYQLYSQYLTALAKALRQQSIQACYHLCTSCYPAEFLQLDASQQQRLQRSLRRAITNSIIDLLSQLKPVTAIRSPNQLSNWLHNTEEAIGLTLPGLSKKMNYLLQQARVVPQQVPRQLIEAAVKADDINDGGGVKRPNILSVLVEKESKEDPENTVIIPVHVIFLRLAEIEFAEIGLSKLRHQIHELRSKVADLRRTYKHRQRQSQSISAASAWHQSWFGAEETPERPGSNHQ
jgi:hypothetical protein